MKANRFARGDAQRDRCRRGFPRPNAADAAGMKLGSGAIRWLASACGRSARGQEPTTVASDRRPAAARNSRRVGSIIDQAPGGTVVVEMGVQRSDDSGAIVAHARIPLTISPCTSVRRKSRPA